MSRLTFSRTTGLMRVPPPEESSASSASTSPVRTEAPREMAWEMRRLFFFTLAGVMRIAAGPVLGNRVAIADLRAEEKGVAIEE